LIAISVPVRHFERSTPSFDPEGAVRARTNPGVIIRHIGVGLVPIRQKYVQMQASCIRTPCDVILYFEQMFGYLGMQE
jgi:hypothetical protein